MPLDSLRKLQFERRRAGLGLPPSDAEYAPKFNSQQMVPNVEAVDRIQSAKDEAAKTIAEQGDLLSRKELDQLLTIARTGAPQKDGKFQKLLTVLDAPGRVVRTAIADFQTGGDKVSFRHYVDGFFGREEVLLDELGAEVAGDDARFSGSQLLKLGGWEEEDNLGGKIGRGIASFAAEVLTDPLTYVTFGTAGLGKKAAGDAVKATVETAAERAAKAIADDAVDGLTGYARKLADDIKPIADDLADKAAKAASEGAVDDVGDAYRILYDEAFEDAAADALKKATDEVVLRDMGSALGDVSLGRFKDLEKNHELLFGELQNFAKGGVRLMAPILRKQLDWSIDLGLRSNWSLRQGTKYLPEWMQGPLHELGRLAGTEGPLMAARRSGSAALDMTYSRKEALLREAGLRGLPQNAVARLESLSVAAGERAEEAQDVVRRMLDGENVDDLIATFDGDVVEQITEAARYAREEVLDKVHAAYSRFDPDVGHIQDYAPRMSTPEFNRWLRDVSTLPIDADAAPEELRLAMQLLNEYKGQAGRVARHGNQNLSGAKFAKERTFGGTALFPFNPETNIHALEMGQRLGVSPTNVSKRRLDELLRSAADWVADNVSGAPRLADDATIFNNNLAEVLDTYVDAMTVSIERKAFIRAAEDFGLHEAANKGLDVGRLSHLMSKDLGVDTMRHFDEARDIMVGVREAGRGISPKTRKVRITPNVSWDVPSQVANDPKFALVVDKLKKALAVEKKYALETARNRKVAILELTSGGVPQAVAETMVDAPSMAALRELQDTYAALVSQANEELLSATATLIQFGQRQGVDEHVNDVVRVVRDRAAQDAANTRAQLGRLEKSLLASRTIVRKEHVGQVIDLSSEFEGAALGGAVVHGRGKLRGLTHQIEDDFQALSDRLLSDAGEPPELLVRLWKEAKDADDIELKRVLVTRETEIRAMSANVARDLKATALAEEERALDLLQGLGAEFVGGEMRVNGKRHVLSRRSDRNRADFVKSIEVETGLGGKFFDPHSGTRQAGKGASAQELRAVRAAVAKRLDAELPADAPEGVRAVIGRFLEADLLRGLDRSVTNSNLRKWAWARMVVANPPSTLDEAVELLSDEMTHAVALTDLVTQLNKARTRVDDGLRELGVTQGVEGRYWAADPILAPLSRGEQAAMHHKDAIEGLLERYGLPSRLSWTEDGRLTATSVVPAGPAERVVSLDSVLNDLRDLEFEGSARQIMEAAVGSDIPPKLAKDLQAVMASPGYARLVTLDESLGRLASKRSDLTGILKTDQADVAFRTRTLEAYSEVSRAMRRALGGGPSAQKVLDGVWLTRRPVLRDALDADVFQEMDDMVALLNADFHIQRAKLKRVVERDPDGFVDDAWGRVESLVDRGEQFVQASVRATREDAQAAAQGLINDVDAFRRRALSQVEVGRKEYYDIDSFDSVYPKGSPEFNETAQNLSRLKSEASKLRRSLKQQIQVTVDGEAKETLRRLRRELGTMGEWSHTDAMVPSGLHKRGFVDPSMFAIGDEELAGRLADRNFLAVLENMGDTMRALYTPEGLGMFTDSAKALERWWKSAATVARPSFVPRNLVGATFANMTIGVGPRQYAEVGLNAAKFRHALHQAKTLDEAFDMLPAGRVREMFRSAWDVGLFDTPFSAELRSIVRRTGTKTQRALGAINPTNTEEFLLFKWGAEFMVNSEDFVRMAAFARYFDEARPQTAKFAKSMALAVHFDYGNLTQIERSFKKFIPFFVWSRRNIPLQMRMLIERPAVFQRYRHLMESVDDQRTRRPEDDLPLARHLSPLAARTDLMINDGTEFWARLILDPDIPAKDIETIANFSPTSAVSWVETISGFLGPWFTAPMDLLSNEDFGDVNAPVGLHQVLSMLDRAGVFDESIVVSDEGDPRVGYGTRSLLETAVPFSREVASLFGAESDPRRRQRLGMDDSETSFADRARAAALTGAKAFGGSLQTPADSPGVAYESQSEINRIIDRLKIEGLIEP